MRPHVMMLIGGLLFFGSGTVVRAETPTPPPEKSVVFLEENEATTETAASASLPADTPEGATAEPVESPTAEAGAPAKLEAIHTSTQETALADKTRIDKLPPQPQVQRERNHSVSVGAGLPVCGFAKGAVHGAGCIRTSEPFFWLDLPVKYHRRVNRRFEWAVGAMASLIYVMGAGGITGHVLADVKLYAVPDWLYFRLRVIIGIPLLFALGPAMGHDFKISKRISIYLENQFTIMAVTGVYGFWQPLLGVKIQLK